MPSASRTSRLAVDGTHRDDSGFYVCTSQKEFGSDTSTVRLTVVEAPDPPTYLRTAAVGTRSVEMRWIPGFDGNDRVVGVRIELCNKTGR